MKRQILILFSLIFISLTQAQNPWNGKVVLQGFWWDYWNNNYPDGWANYLSDLAPRLRDLGVDAVWIPPTYKNTGVNSVGYSPFDHYDLGDKYQKGETKTRVGNKDDLLKMIAILHANGIEVIQDIVLNHVDNAGSQTGAGGQDLYALNNYNDWTTSGYKNFRYVSFDSPADSTSAFHYLNRKGRWPKNWQNFYPNQFNACCSNDLNSVYWGPDVSYESNAYGQSSCVNCYNPNQNQNYMLDEARNWFVWFKKQTGVDGYRFDAVKHFPTYVVEDLLWNAQNNAGFASGGTQMYAVGEYVGGGSDLDNWVSAVQNRAGTFDFGLRDGLYGMTQGSGFYDIGNIPNLQQGNRQRTVAFVNNHDTFRPQFDANGNYIGWNTGDELAPHIDPFDPRSEAAHAIAFAVDGSPMIFMEDLFNLSNGNRYSHWPTNHTDLPIRDALANIIWCHQKLNFKNGAYKVRHQDPDHLIIERSGKAIISANDNWSTWQNAWIQTDFAPGTQLHDYSGANSNDIYVNNSGWVEIHTPPCDGSNMRRGYSIWGPAGITGGFNPNPKLTTQEWEMANDLGDSHPWSLQQGGALPTNSLDYRYVGKVHSDTGLVQIDLYPADSTQSIKLLILDDNDVSLDSITGVGHLVLNYNVTVAANYKIKIRNASINNSGQKVWVKVTYKAPKQALGNNVPVHTKDAAQDVEVKLYPNPTYDRIFLAAPISSKVNAEILDVTGQLIMEMQTTLQGEIDLQNLDPGNYFIRLSGDKVNVFKKLVKL
ncbi:MAG: DUF1939 domain-containing protein [Flavobacteriales bacterium]|nr:DUF1939 domain-containing protein [Flavobacteriales bacterium]